MTQIIPEYPPLVEEDITELPYAIHDVPGEYDIGQIIHLDASPAVVRKATTSTSHNFSSPPRNDDEQDLADALVPDNYAPLADTLPSRPRSRKDGLGASGWEDRMQQWTQDIPRENT